MLSIRIDIIAGVTDGSTTRVRHDSMGAVNVEGDKLWGAQTQRSLEHFSIAKTDPA